MIAQQGSAPRAVHAGLRGPSAVRGPTLGLGSAVEQLVLREADRRPVALSRRRLTPRDDGIFLALDSYRYLDSAHIAALFFRGERKARGRLQELAARGLIASWRARLEPVGLNRPNIHRLTPAGARRLAQRIGAPSRAIAFRAFAAARRLHQLVHDLEANAFFVALAAQSRSLADEGLYHWLGPRTCRLVAARGGIPPSDGWGRYLLPDRELRFSLEWDRGTEHAQRLETVARAYVRYSADRRGAERHHVLFVLPSAPREDEVRAAIAAALRRAMRRCRFWTTTVAQLERAGPLGAIWLEAGAVTERSALAAMAGVDRSALPVADCIGKPQWWERRRAGGEGA